MWHTDIILTNLNSADPGFPRVGVLTPMARLPFPKCYGPFVSITKLTLISQHKQKQT